MLFNLLSDSTGNNGGGTMWIMLGLLVVIMIVMMVMQNRANKKRQKEAEEKLNGMQIGDRVKTIGGICGIVVEINDDENTFVLETGKENSGNFIKFDKIAVYQTSHPVSEEEKATENTEAVEENVETANVEEAVEENTTETNE